MNDFQAAVTATLTMAALWWCVVAPTPRISGWRALTILATLATTTAALLAYTLILGPIPNLAASVLWASILLFIPISRVLGTTSRDH